MSKFADSPFGRVQVRHQPGMATSMMRELAPFLAEEGIDADNIEVDSIADLNAAIERANAKREEAMFNPTGEARAYALTTLRLIAEAIACGEKDLAEAILESIPSEAPDGNVATVANCMGVGLIRADEWFHGTATDVPAGLSAKTRIPSGRWTGKSAAADILSLARKGRAYASLDGLHRRQDGRSILYGIALVVAGAMQAWADLTSSAVAEVAGVQLRVE